MEEAAAEAQLPSVNRCYVDHVTGSGSYATLIAEAKQKIALDRPRHQRPSIQPSSHWCLLAAPVLELERSSERTRQKAHRISGSSKRHGLQAYEMRILGLDDSVVAE